MEKFLIATIVFFLSVFHIVYAAEDKTATIIGNGTYEKWLLLEVELRKESDKYVKIEDNSINISAISRLNSVWFFYPVAVPCKDRWHVEFAFKAEGTGQGQIGFFSYLGDNWEPADAFKAMSFDLEKNIRDYKFNLPVNGKRLKTIRVFIGANSQSEVKFTDLKITITDEDKTGL